MNLFSESYDEVRMEKVDVMCLVCLRAISADCRG